MRVAIVIAAIIVGSGFSAFAQTQAPSAGQPAPAASDRSAPSRAGQPQSGEKRTECRKQAREKKLRSAERRDFVQVCTLEGRLECLKRAIEQKLTGSSRREFVKSCVG